MDAATGQLLATIGTYRRHFLKRNGIGYTQRDPSPDVGRLILLQSSLKTEQARSAQAKWHLSYGFLRLWLLNTAFAVTATAIILPCQTVSCRVGLHLSQAFKMPNCCTNKPSKDATDLQIPEGGVVTDGDIWYLFLIDRTARVVKFRANAVSISTSRDITGAQAMQELQKNVPLLPLLVRNHEIVEEAIRAHI